MHVPHPVTFDLAYVMYWVALVALVYNNLLFLAWAIVSGAIRDRRYRVMVVNILAMGGGFVYVVAVAVYARHLKNIELSAYGDFLSSTTWGMRYAVVVALMMVVSVRLTIWAYAALREYIAGRLNRRQR